MSLKFQLGFTKANYVKNDIQGRNYINEII